MRLRSCRLLHATLLLIGSLMARSASAAYHELDPAVSTHTPVCVNVPAGQPVAFEIQGTMSNGAGPNQGPYTADGKNEVAGAGFPAPGLRSYSVVAYVGGVWIQLGVAGQFISPGGPITVVVNDDFHGDNTGQFKMVIGPGGALATQVYFVNGGVTDGSGWNFGFGQAGLACIHWLMTSAHVPAGLGPQQVAAAIAQRINDQGFALIQAQSANNIFQVTTPGGSWDLWLQDGGPACNAYAPGGCLVQSAQQVTTDPGVLPAGITISRATLTGTPLLGVGGTLTLLVSILTVGGLLGWRRRRKALG